MAQIDTMRTLFAIEREIKEQIGVDEGLDFRINQVSKQIGTYINMCIGGNSALVEVSLRDLQKDVEQLTENLRIDES